MSITRRVLLQGLATGALCRAAPLFASAPARQVINTLPAPQSIHRVVSAGAPADLLMLAAAPEKLSGLSSFDFSREASGLFPEVIRQLPEYGRLVGGGRTLSLEKLLSLQPDLIIDCGSTDETWRSQAKRIASQTKIPWVLLNGELAQSAQQFTAVGEILGVEKRTQKQAELAQHFISEAQAFSRTAAAHLRFYAARGPRGLETGLQGSLHTEAAELLGLENVARIAGRSGLTQVSIENLLLWQPDIILVQDKTTLASLLKDPAWQGVSAVAHRRILLLDGLPFGWLDAPPGINRLLGMRRLQAWLDPAVATQLQADMQHYSRLFWHRELSEKRYKTLVDDL
ncbi:iron-dicitrate transporter substrate-binding subunit [Cedecea lapagei]|uniref:Iron-dicitrate transporter substrate-binding subunit n=1 Tax=Cedecea lapagei TaxID=158823 RepID=A0A3S4JZ25_9ENTR|nr:iron ABC transporter substrate-binding protein [Cedecea lapagei]VEB97212.1 iron-dicitrate transporter substrate-binding subunit [Cedecea lapagei]